LGAAAFDLFFLVPTGRGKAIADMELSPAEYEKALHWVYDRSLDAGIPVKPTCAPHYMRIRSQCAIATGNSAPERPGKGCMAGQGFIFISYNGIVQPCGFLDMNCGDLRGADFDVKRLYETSPIFQLLRDTSAYQGACGACSYVEICGGCRARAFSATGNVLAEEPYCVYTPPKKTKTVSCA